MLELGGSLPICGDCCPFVRPGDILVGPCIDHRLDGEDMTLLHEPCCFVSSVVRDIGSRVEKRACSMTTVCSIDCESK